MCWINVKEKLPEQGKDVLCFGKDGEVYVASYNRRGCYYEPFYRDVWEHGFCCGREPSDPSHWMDIPEKPLE